MCGAGLTWRLWGCSCPGTISQIQMAIPAPLRGTLCIRTQWASDSLGCPEAPLDSICVRRTHRTQQGCADFSPGHLVRESTAGSRGDQLEFLLVLGKPTKPLYQEPHAHPSGSPAQPPWLNILLGSQWTQWAEGKVNLGGQLCCMWPLLVQSLTRHLIP